MPATSANVTRIVSGSTRRAFELPNAPRPPIPPAALARAACEQHEQADDQQRRAEPEQQLGDQRLAGGRRLRVDLHALFLKHRRELAAVPERRDLRGEQLRLARLRVVRRVALLGPEVAFDRVALRGDRAHLPRLDLRQEVRAEGDRHPRFAARGRVQQYRDPVDRDDDQHEPQEPRPAVGRAACGLVLWHAPSVRRGLRLPPALVARQRGMGIGPRSTRRIGARRRLARHVWNGSVSTPRDLRRCPQRPLCLFPDASPALSA